MFPDSLRGDVEWYVQKAVASGGPVLELGAGTGRITIPVAEAGVRVAGLELSEPMLTGLTAKVAALPSQPRGRIALHHGDMRTFSSSERYALVIIPFRAFLHNLTRDDQIATLRRAHAHLQDGGELALNMFHPSLEFMARNAGAQTGVWRWSQTRKTPEGFVVYSDASRYDTVRQRVESMMRTEEFNSAGSPIGVHMTHLELAYLYPADIRSLLDDTGFELIRISGDFHGRPFAHDDDELVVEARKR